MPSVIINILSQGFFVFGWPETIFFRMSSSKSSISKYLFEKNNKIQIFITIYTRYT